MCPIIEIPLVLALGRSQPWQGSPGADHNTHVLFPEIIEKWTTLGASSVLAISTIQTQWRLENACVEGDLGDTWDSLAVGLGY